MKRRGDKGFLRASAVFTTSLMWIQLATPTAVAQSEGKRASALSSIFADRFFQETDEERRRLEQVNVTKKEERQIGEAAWKNYLNSLERKRIRVVRRGKDVNYLNDLVKEIQPLMHQADRYQSIAVRVANSSAIDARAFPGGKLIFTRGLLEFAKSEAAIIGIVGHELSHLDRGHVLDRVRRVKLAQQTLSSGKLSPGDFMTSTKLFVNQFVRPFHPEQETEADLDAARWLVESKYDPMEMANLFLHLHEKAADNQPRLPVFFRTHPYHVDRFKAIRTLTDEHGAGKTQKLYIGQLNLKNRIPRSKKRFPE